MRNIHFVPECYAETELVKHIFDFTDSDYPNHASGIQEVCKILKKKNVPNYIYIGFVDNDKHNVPPYFDEFELIEEHFHVLFKKHPQSNDCIFIAKPAIEKFILSQLEEMSKKPSDYDLPDEFNDFKKKLKKQSIQYHEGYKELIRDIRKANTSGISFMIDKVEELRKG